MSLSTTPDPVVAPMEGPRFGIVASGLLRRPLNPCYVHRSISREGNCRMPLMNRLRLALSAVALACLALFALAGAASPASAANLSNVRMVDYGAGAFVQTAPFTWAEVDKSTWQVSFNFEEYFRSASALKFIDRSRNMQILVDAASGQILYASGNEGYQPLYSIVGTATVSRIPGSKVSWDGTPDAPKNVTVDGGQGATPVPTSFDGYSWKFARAHAASGFEAVTGWLSFTSASRITMVEMRCQVGDDGASIQASFAADIGNLASAAKTAVEFTAEGFYDKLAATAIAAQGKIPSGFIVTAPISDALWRGLLGRRSINYKVVGRPTVKLPLAAGSSAISQFVAECENAHL